jgi:hypothetical protein
MKRRRYTIHHELPPRDLTGVATRGLLDAAFLATCQSGADEGQTHALGIRPQCHATAGVDVFYRAGEVSLFCHACRTPFMLIAVQDDREAL